jgi:CheY-like chemotaxis protein
MDAARQQADQLEDEPNRHLDAGMDDFLEKPINPQLFQEMMSKWAARPLDPVPVARA